MWPFIKTNRGRIILGLISGMMLALAFPKMDQGWLAWAGLMPLLLAIRQAGVRESFFIGIWTGFVHFLGLMYWTAYTMRVYGYLPVSQCVILLLLLAAYLSLYIGLFSMAVSWICTRPWHLVVVGPAIWVAQELLRAHLFTGFPWESLGYSQYGALWIIQFADILGVYGVSGLIVLVNAALTIAVLYWLEKPWRQEAVSKQVLRITAGSTLSLVLLVGAYGAIRLKTVENAIGSAVTKKVAVVQGNIDQAHKWDPSFQMITAARYKHLSQQIAGRGIDLIIWPETATPFYLLQDPLLSRLVIDGIKETDTAYLIGSPSYVKTPNAARYYNSAYLISADGEPVGKYDKVHLVPFGEYVPLKKWLPFIHKMVEHVGDFDTGKKGSTLSWQHYRIGVQICYEVIFPDLARSMAKNGAHLLINITNDAWFGFTSAAYQHFSMAVFRSVENRRSLARAANTGISGFIDPSGRIVAKTDLFVEAAASAELPLMTIPTHYTRWGDWPMAVFAFGVLAVGAGCLFFSRRIRSKTRVSG